ncbi:MAG: phosphomannomutase [Pseudomonadota bacterium]
MNPAPLSAFRLGDVRGIYPVDLDEAFAHAFAAAFVRRFGIRGRVATGRDMRASSLSLQSALNEGLLAAGVSVTDLGLCTTELGYFASSMPTIDAAIIVTASHNPARYNGFKCVLQNGQAVTFDTGLNDVMRLMQQGPDPSRHPPGRYAAQNLQPDYITFLARQLDMARLQQVPRIALNGLNGTAATLAVKIAEQFSLPVTWFRQEPGPIPEQGADPTSPALAAEMKAFMQGGAFALGVAWDGDCDRCVFFDPAGDLIPTYYVIGVLAEQFLRTHPGRAIVFDTKLCWNTRDIVERSGGIAVASETGHAFMKHHMRQHNAIYGGELSSHHFFGDFFHCDSGIFAWLTVLDLMQRTGQDLGELIAARRAAICCTPEISLRLGDPLAAFTAVTTAFAPRSDRLETFDGPGFELDHCRFTLRQSKTENAVRLNFESRGKPDQLLALAREVLATLLPFRTDDADVESRIYIQ